MRSTSYQGNQLDLSEEENSDTYKGDEKDLSKDKKF
jgi:hypothetical protein